MIKGENRGFGYYYKYNNKSMTYEPAYIRTSHDYYGTLMTGVNASNTQDIRAAYAENCEERYEYDDIEIALASSYEDDYEREMREVESALRDAGFYHGRRRCAQA